MTIEKFKVEARRWEARPDGQMSMHIETACGAVAGGLAGFLTTPLDVMKTLLQTQVKKPSVCSWMTLGSVLFKPEVSNLSDVCFFLSYL